MKLELFPYKGKHNVILFVQFFVVSSIRDGREKDRQREISSVMYSKGFF